jgi:MFS family permease
MTTSGSTPPQGSETPAVKKPKMPVKRRLILMVLALVMLLLPAIVMVLIAWIGTGKVQGAATWASIPALVGTAAVLSGGRRFGIIVSIVMAFLAPLAIVAGSSPVAGAALMAILCMTVGRLSRVGLQKSGLLVPVMLAWPLIDPPAWNGAATVDRLDNSYLLWMTAIFFVGAIIPVILIPLFMRKRKAPTLGTHTQSEAVTYTVVITTLITIATFYVLDNPKLIGGGFLIAVILVMAPIGTVDTIKPTIFRILGTVVGSVLVILLVSKVDSLGLIYLIGLVLILIAVYARLSGLAWVYYVFMVPATASLNSTSLTQVGELGKQRVVDNVVGGILVIIATVIVIAFSSWSNRHHQVVEADPEVSSLSTV